MASRLEILSGTPRRRAIANVKECLRLAVNIRVKEDTKLEARGIK